LINGSSGSPVDDVLRVNEELTLFHPMLAQKPQIIALNKVDLPEVAERLPEIKKILTGAGINAHYISAAKGTGVDNLMHDAMKLLRSMVDEEKSIYAPVKVFRPKPRQTGVTVSKQGDKYIVSAPELERIIAGAGASPSEIQWQLNKQLLRLGVNRALVKAGAKYGDKIRCGEMEWEWSPPGREG
jgi:GTP-binding protein